LGQTTVHHCQSVVEIGARASNIAPHREFFVEAVESEKKKLETVIAIEVLRIIEDIGHRREFLVEVWSRHRTRAPLLDTVFTRWNTLGFLELRELDTETAVFLDAFHREVERLRLYLGFTEDMPATLDHRIHVMHERLTELGDKVIETVGGRPERPEYELLNPWELPKN